MGGSVYSSSYSRGYSGGGYSPWSYSEQSSRRERPRLRHTLEKEGFSKNEIYVLPEKPKQEIKQEIKQEMPGRSRTCQCQKDVLAK